MWVFVGQDVGFFLENKRAWDLYAGCAWARTKKALKAFFKAYQYLPGTTADIGTFKTASALSPQSDTLAASERNS